MGKGEAGSKSANCSLLLEAPLYCRVIHGIIVFARFLLLHVTERTDFYITQIYAREDYYEQKNQVVLALEG